MGEEAARPLLATKLFIPPVRGGLVTRPRLTQRFANTPTHKLTLISAPAGFGKTTLISCWLTQQNRPVAWVSLDASDNDPVLFFSYFLAALQQIDRRIGQTGRAMLQTELPDYQALIISLINELTQVNQSLILILDDYHLIKAQAIHDALMLLIENQPPQLHLAIISRTEPPLPIAKLRAKHQLVEVGSQDLRFTQAETEQFLNELMQLNLSLDDVAKLEKHTEGWITGLQLSALSLQNAPSAASLIEHISGDDRFIADYLIEEVLSAQANEIQHFLLHTSILNQMNADLCNALLQISNSQAILETIERSNLFVVPLDNSRQWYRYHHLFADLLQSRLRLLYPEAVAGLYGRAFAWHKQNDRLEDAVRYALQGEMYETAADIIEKIGPRVYWQNRSHTVEEWLNNLPESIHQMRPNLRLLTAYSHIDNGDLQQMERTLQRLAVDLQQHPLDSPEEQRIVEGKLAAALTAVTYHTYLDGKKGHELAQQALAALPLEFSYERSVAAFHGGGSLILLGELNEARRYLQEALKMVDLSRSQQNQARILTLSNLGHLEMAAGALQQANSYFQQAYQLAHQINVRQGSTFSNAVSGLANLHYEWNDLDTAEKYIQEGIQIVEKDTFLDRIMLAYRVCLRIKIARKDFAQAQAIIQRAWQLAAQYNAPAKINARIACLAASVALAEGDGVKTAIWVKQFTEQFAGLISYEQEFELLTYCKILIGQGEVETAITHLHDLLDLAQKQARIRSIIRIRILLAQAYYLAGDQLTAVDNLQQALSLAEPEGFIRAFITPGKVIENLLLELQKQGPTAPSAVYIQKILDAYAQEQDPFASVKIGPEQFTTRELEVLHALAEGLTYATIGDKLTISENTVRTHIKNIYSKLGVHNRTQVLLQAQEIGLL